MPNFTSTDWKAIDWYKKEFNLSIRDMAAGPVVRFRDKDDKIVDVNIFAIRKRYDKRSKTKKKVAS